jgi:predicted CoA-binding protein
MVIDEEQIQDLLRTSRVIAVVGLSPDEEKASNRVARYLKDKGYRIIPVNPAYEEILGEKAYKSLGEIPEQVDIVDIFMRAEKVMPFVEEALKLNPKAIWLQLGIKSADARKLVEKTDVGYVEDKCVKIEHSKLLSV